MAVKLADTLAPMGAFEVADAKDISVEIDGNKKMLQTAIDNGEIGGGGDSSWTGTQAEFDAYDKSQLKDGQEIIITDDYDVVNGNVYSTEEVVVGKWIDGKPIYRKTVSFATISTDFQDPNVIATNVAELVNTHGSVNFTSWGNTTRTTIPLALATAAAGGYVTTVIYNGTLGLFYSVAGASWTFKDAVVTVEYTKNTN